jgi:hypothetical protein
VPLLLGDPAGDGGREAEDDLIIPVAADGAEAALHVVRDPEVGRPVGRLAGRPAGPDPRDREHPDPPAEMAGADGVPAVLDEGQVVRVGP